MLLGSSRRDEFLFRWRAYLPYLLVLPLLLAIPESGWVERRLGDALEMGWDVLSAFIAFAGLVLRMATAGYLPANTDRRATRSLTVTGLYSVVRHPLYLGNFFILLGLALSTHVWWTILLTLGASCFFYTHVAAAEEARLAERIGAPYAAWRAHTPAFLPDFHRWRSTTEFSFRRALRSEQSTAFRLIAALVAIEFATDLLGEGEPAGAILAGDVYWLWLLAVGVMAWGALLALDRRVPRRVRFWLSCLICFVVLEQIVRVALLGWSIGIEFNWTRQLLHTLPIGALDDIMTGLVLAAPFLVGLYLFPRLLARRFAGYAANMLLFVLLLALTFTAAAELTFWGEFDGRFNSIAVNYLIFPREVIGNIGQSFNLAMLLPLVGAVALALFFALRPLLMSALADDIVPGERRRGFIIAGVSLAIGVAAATVNPTEIFADRTINEVAKNGFHSFVRAAVTNDQRYEGIYLGLPEPEAQALIRRMVTQDNTTLLKPESEPGLWRRVDNGAVPRKLNVVMILNESFGSTYVDGLDNRRSESISPRLTAMAKDGLFFTNVYATGNRTVRALESVFTSFPPIPGVSTARRPNSEGMNSLPFLLKRHGYQTAFLYAGRGAFDNMGHFWSTVGFDKVWDQGDIADQGFTTIWGVADEYLYGEALNRLDALTQAGAPVYLSMLTVSNHRPFTYPAGRIDKDPGLKRSENAATYSDWAFGDFIERARGRPWFRDTIFVFMGDHGPRVYGAAQVPVPSYRIPLLFYAPSHIAGERNPVLGSNMDVAPTLMGLLGISYDSPFFGVDLRRVPEGRGRVTMEHNFSVALGDGHDVAMLLPRRDSRGYAMQIGPGELRPLPAADPELLRRTIALIQTAHYMFYRHQYHELGESVAVAGR